MPPPQGWLHADQSLTAYATAFTMMASSGNSGDGVDDAENDDDRVSEADEDKDTLTDGDGVTVVVVVALIEIEGVADTVADALTVLLVVTVAEWL